jgi:hypothetical protein
MANQITVNSGSGNITVTTSRAVIGTVANVASANYANFAGEAFDVSGSNVTGAVANATFATTAGSANTANTANSATVANSANSVAGANVTGTVANATFATTAGSATTAGTVTTSAQPNITSIGTLSNLNVSNTITTNNLVVTGNFSVGNLVANNANYANFAGEAFDVALANVSGAGNIASINIDGSGSNVLYGNGIFAPAATGNVANANYANFAGNAFSVDGGNVVGAVANATFALDAGNANIANIAYSVDAANVTGLGNIATINLDGNVSNLLTGNGTFVAIPTGGANANYANFAGNAFSVDGGNVVGAVANATFALDAGNANIANVAYSVDGANVSGAVANATFALDAGNANIANIAYSVDAANVSGLGNIATINLDGNASNFLDGTGNFVAAPGGANANYANFAGQVIDATQSNITSVGNLTALTVTGTLTGNAITWSNLLTYTGSGTSDKINVQADLPGAATVRNLSLRGANISNALASNTTAGGTILNGGGATSTDAGNVWVARSGGIACTGGTANTANGNAFGGGGGFQGGAAVTLLGNATGGGFNLINGSANSSNGSATSGAVQIGLNTSTSINGNANAGETRIGLMSATANSGNAGGGGIQLIAGNTRTITSGNASAGGITILAGNARSENGNATSGGINITTASAIANVTAGTATVGSVSINTGTANGITANVLGNINIGNTGTANAVNIGAATTPVNVTGNLTANNANITNNVSANIVNATYLYGDGSNISNLGGVSSIQNGNSIVNFSGPDGALLISTNNLTNTVQVNGRNLTLFGANTGGGDISKIELINGALNWQLDNTSFSGGTPFGMNRYNTGFLEPLNYFTARGNVATPADVQTGDTVFAERMQVLYDGTTHSIFNGDVSVLSFSPSNTVAATYTVSSNDDQANSVFQVNFGTSNIAGALTTVGNVNVSSGNVVLDTTGNITAVGRLDYLRTFGSFTSNATQTSNGANTTNYMTLNNTEDANGISIASSTQITVARPGRYNIQFSAQLEKTDSGSDTIEIWLDKNGTAVANTATQILLAGNNAKSVAAWDFNVNAANVNDYFRLAWASPDTDVQITAVPAANTISGVAIPSVIVDINPIGA